MERQIFADGFRIEEWTDRAENNGHMIEQLGILTTMTAALAAFEVYKAGTTSTVLYICSRARNIHCYDPRGDRLKQQP